MWESFAHQARIFWKFDFLNDFFLAWLWHAIARLWHAISRNGLKTYGFVRGIPKKVKNTSNGSEPKSPSDGIHNNLEPFGIHLRIPRIPRIPSDSPDSLGFSGSGAATAVRTLPSTRAGGQDDVS